MRRLWILLLATSAHAPLALAQAPPACVPAREGMVACFGEKLCECRWEPGGSLTGRPAGHRWDCGALRPGCGTAPAGPAAESLPLQLSPLLQPPALSPRSGAGAAPHGTR